MSAVVVELEVEDEVEITAGANDVAIAGGMPALVRTATTDELIEAAAADDCSALASNPVSDADGELGRMVLGAALEGSTVTEA